MIDDDRTDGHCLRKMIDELIASNVKTDVPLAEMKKELMEVARPIANRVKLPRHNVFSFVEKHEHHLSGGDGKAAITPDDLDALIEIYARISDTILVRIFQKRSWFSNRDRMETATRRLIADLAHVAGHNPNRTKISQLLLNIPRTWDPLIKSQLLYQLSYAPGSPLAEEPAETGVV